MSEHILEPILNGNTFPYLPVPSLEAVRKDAAEAPTVRQRLQPSIEDDFVIPFVEAPTGQRLQDLLPHLYTYSTRARCDDIPDDLVGECIWALEIQSACWHRHREPDHSLETLAPLALRLGKLSSRPDPQRPGCAVEPMKNLRAYLRCMKGSNPVLNLEYAILLAELAVNDDEAERILTGFLASDEEEASSRRSRIRAQLYLTRVLRRKDRVQEASVMEGELVRWFKRNPHVFSDSALKDLWTSKDGEVQTDPVLTALGGSSWLDNRKRTIRTEGRLDRTCIHCNNDDLRVNFKMCGACKDAWYCSVQCQKANWPFHKEICKWVAERRQNIRIIEQGGDPINEPLRDLRAWDALDIKTNCHTAIHALGLHRDPTRGRTHIYIRKVEHDPSAVSLSKKFSVASCGVFRIEDVLGTLEKALGLSEGEGQGTLRKYFLPFETGGMSHMLPTFRLVVCWLRGGNKVNSLCCNAISPDTIDQVSYDPNWMQTVNRRGKQVPKTILWLSGAKNAEIDF